MNMTTLSASWKEGALQLGDIASKSKTGVFILLGCLLCILIIKIVVDLAQ